MLTIEDFSSNWPEAANFFEFVKSFFEKNRFIVNRRKNRQEKSTHQNDMCFRIFFLTKWHCCSGGRIKL